MVKGKRDGKVSEPATPKARQTSIPADAPEKPEVLSSAPDPLPIRDGGDASDRVSVKLIDGKFDVTTLRAKTAEKFQAAIKLSLNDPEFRKAVGLEGVPASVIEESFKPEHFGMLLDTVVMIETAVMVGKTALPQPEVDRFLKWSPEEHACIDTIGARVLGRYLPGEWLKYTDLIMLVMTFVSITVKKISALNSYAKAEVEKIGRAKSPEPMPEPTAEPLKEAA